MARYSKLIAAVVGLLAIVIGPEFLNLTDQGELIAESIAGIITALLVYQLPNRVPDA